jgi:putative spermidine/putrescine transport system permease protein
MAQPQSLVNRRMVMDWLGIVPFMLFAILFLILPTLYLVTGAFFNPAGEFTFQNFRDLFQPTIMAAYWISIKVSTASAIGGLLIGFFLAWAITQGGLPGWIRSFVLTFSGVASNFAGVPLAFAFLATLGRTGLLTFILTTYFGFNIYSHGFNLLSFLGLTLTYMYFQIPLMVLIITPALDGLKKEWREAASILGATSFQYPLAEPDGHVLAAFRQCFRRHRHCLRADRIVAQHRADRALCADSRRRAAQSEPGLCHRHGHGDHHGRIELPLYLASYAC